MIIIKEIWKDITGYEGLYQVSNLGEVKSLERMISNGKGLVKVKERILTQSITNWGYYRVALYKNGVRKYCKVHRLVAEAFIPNPESKEQVNHIDGNKLNNCVDNLEWSTRIENLNHARINGLYGKNYESNYILLKDDNDNIISQYNSKTKLSEIININNGKILKTFDNNNVNYEITNEINPDYPLNKKLNSFKRCSKYYPIGIYDNEMNLLAVYTNIASMTENTGIPEARGNEASKKEKVKYRKRVKENQKYYYIKKITFTEFFLAQCDIIDDFLEIETEIIN